MEESKEIYPLIMAGGVGSRLYPLSTPEKPKQFLNLLDDHQSLLQMTLERLRPSIRAHRIQLQDVWVVSHARYETLLRDQLPDLAKQNFLLEPELKNTTASIAWAAWEMYKKDPEAIMVVMPADHWIEDVQSFNTDLAIACQFIKKNTESLLTFGVQPTSPHTGYGYIKKGASMSSSSSDLTGGSIFKIRKFVEKPDIQTARTYLKSGQFFWHSGPFVWKAKRILEELKKFEPKIYEGVQKMNASTISQFYRSFEKIAIDYAVMERSEDIYVMQASFDWSDLGSWEVFASLQKDRFDQVVKENPKIKDYLPKQLTR